MSLRYFPLDGTYFRLSMGLQALRSRSFLDIDQGFSRDLAEKKRLLDEYRDHVVAETDGTRTAQNEILTLIETERNAHHPDAPAPIIPEGESSPLVEAALHVQEDLVLMRESPDGYILAAACVCFPTGWNLVEKIGRPMQSIHQPVPGLNDRIGAPIDRFFRNLKPGKKVERFNWGLYDSDTLFQPGWWRRDRSVDRSITAENIGERIFFRVERQTLQRLPNASDILFTIRIFNNSLSEICESQDRAARLLNGIETMGADMQRYKSLPRYKSLLMDFLGKAAA